MIRRTQLRALRRDSSQSDVHDCETSVRRSAKMQKDPNVRPQASQTPSAKTRLARKSHERQPTERRQECLKHEREQCGSNRRVDRSISAHTGLSRGVPADHEAQSQVKQKTAAKVKALEEGLTSKTVRIAKFKIVGMATLVHGREENHENTRREVASDSDKKSSCSRVHT